MDKEHGPLSTLCVKNLQDKLYDKRKQGAQEIERLVREYSANGEHSRIEEIISIMLSDFLMSTNCHTRKGGLIGLASVALGLGRSSQYYAESLTTPVIRCLQDPDSGVKYYAVEALYNIIKILKADSLPLFNDIFDGLSKCTADEDSSVRKGCAQLDRLIKDLVTDNPRTFQLAPFIGTLRERMYTKNMHTRQFLVAWLRHLLTVPHLHVAQYTGDLLDGLLCMLMDARRELSLMCAELLDSLLMAMERLPPGLQPVPYAEMTEQLIQHCKVAATASSGATFRTGGVGFYQGTTPLTAETSAALGTGPPMAWAHSDDASILVQKTTLVWLETFLKRVGPQLLPQASGIASAVLPCLAARDEEDGREIYNAALLVNKELMYIFEASHTSTSIPLSNVVSESTSSTDTASSVLEHTLGESKKLESKEEPCNVSGGDALSTSAKRRMTVANVPGEMARLRRSQQTLLGMRCLDVSKFMQVLCQQLASMNEATQLATLRWISILLQGCPAEAFLHWQELLPLLLKTLTDASAEVIQWDLKVVSQICATASCFTEGVKQQLSQTEELWCAVYESLEKANVPSEKPQSPLLLYFMLQLLRLFDTDELLLANKGDVIVSMLCGELGAHEIYSIVAEIIICLPEAEYVFASTLVKSFNRYLLTQSQLYGLRQALQCLDTPARCHLFSRLYRAWCHHPVSLLSLCFLTQSYQHATVLVKHFGYIELSVDMLTEMDRLVQLIESPVFAYVRLHLLDPKHSEQLQETLYSLLMCLPQTEAFLVLRRRLDCVPPHQLTHSLQSIMSREEEPDPAFVVRYVDFNELIAHFRRVQDSVRERKIALLQRDRLEKAFKSKLPMK